MAHSIQSVIVFDVETGGLDPTKNPMCSIALSAFSMFDCKELTKYSAIIQPYDNLEYVQQALDHNGFKYADLLKGKPIKQVVAELCEQFQLANITGSKKKLPCVAGHNVGFDIGFLMYAFNTCKVDISKYLHCNLDGYGHQIPASMDTMWLSRLKYGGDITMTAYNLGACCDKTGVVLTDSHDAMNDTLATKDVLVGYANNLRSGSTSESQVTKKERKRDYFSI